MKVKLFNKLAVFIMVILFSASLLSGCDFRYFLRNLDQETFNNSTAEFETQTTEEGSYQPRDYDFVGSATQLQGTVLAVIIYMSDAESSWTIQDKWAVQDKLDIAADYIEDAARSYGKSVDIISDVGQNSNLLYETYYNGYIQDFDTLDESGLDPYQETLLDEIIYNIPSNQLLQEYNATSIAYIGVIDKDGRSYAYPYDEGYGQDYYNECTCIFFRDETYSEEEPPAVYAHELLHLFGAPDLYENDDPYYNDFSPSQYDYIESNYSNEIMYTTYDEYGYSVHDRVSNDITAITAYYLGWIDELPLGFVERAGY